MYWCDTRAHVHVQIKCVYKQQIRRYSISIGMVTKVRVYMYCLCQSFEFHFTIVVCVQESGGVSNRDGSAKGTAVLQEDFIHHVTGANDLPTLALGNQQIARVIVYHFLHR